MAAAGDYSLAASNHRTHMPDVIYSHTSRTWSRPIQCWLRAFPKKTLIQLVNFLFQYTHSSGHAYGAAPSSNITTWELECKVRPGDEPNLTIRRASQSTVMGKDKVVLRSDIDPLHNPDPFVKHPEQVRYQRFIAT